MKKGLYQSLKIIGPTMHKLVCILYCKLRWFSNDVYSKLSLRKCTKVLNLLHMYVHTCEANTKTNTFAAFLSKTSSIFEHLFWNVQLNFCQRLLKAYALKMLCCLKINWSFSSNLKCVLKWIRKFYVQVYA